MAALEVATIPPTAEIPFEYVIEQLMQAGPPCAVRIVEAESALWADQLARAAAAFPGTGLMSSDPPAWIGDLGQAAAGFDGTKVFVREPSDTRAWLLKRASSQEHVDVPSGQPVTMEMERHDLADGRTVWILTNSFAVLQRC